MCNTDNTDIKKQQQEGAVTDSDYADRNRLKHIEASLRTKYKHKIFNKFVQAICDFDLVRPDDKIAVCISGGKDSMLMAKLFQELKRRNKIPFEVKFLSMDPGYAERNRQQIEHNAALLNIPITFFNTKVFDATPKCSMRCFTWNKIPATCAPKCAGVSCTGTHRRRAAIKSRWAITSTTSLKRIS